MKYPLLISELKKEFKNNETFVAKLDEALTAGTSMYSMDFFCSNISFYADSP